MLQATRGGSFAIAVADKLVSAAHGQSLVSELASGQLRWQHEALTGKVVVVTGCSGQNQSPNSAGFCMMWSMGQSHGCSPVYKGYPCAADLKLWTPVQDLP